MRRSHRSLAMAAAALGALSLAAVAFAPAVRARVHAIAEARGLDVTVGHVLPGWFSVELSDVHVAPVGQTSAQIRIRSVRAHFGLFLALDLVEAHGADVSVVGSRAELADAFRSWGSRGTSTGTGGRTAIVCDEITVAWRERRDQAPALELTGGSVARRGAGWGGSFVKASFDVKVDDGGLRLEVADANVQLAHGGVLALAHASRVGVSWIAARQLSAPVKPSAPEPAPPPLPPVPGKRGAQDEKRSEGKIAVGAYLDAPRLPLPMPAELHLRLVALGAVARDRLAPDARIETDVLAFELVDGQRRLKVGQGPLSISRENESLSIRFHTRTDDSGTPIEVDATLPLEAGDAAASLAGGPVSLALLGIDEGAAGLVDVDRTTVSGRGHISLAAAGGALTFDGKLAVRGLAVNNPRLALDVVRGIDASLIARGVLDDGGALRLDDAEASLGAIRALAHGSIEQTAEHFAASVAFELPTAPCDSLLRSIPSALAPTLNGAVMAGTLGINGRIAFDSRSLDDTVFDWNADDRCAMSVVPEGLAHDRFTQPFDHTIYLPDGTLAAQTTGPTSDDWTPLVQISPFMQVAVLTTEDGAFYRHHGFNRAAIRNALVANLKAGRFVRGASTITMQLAKNLFLSRDKTVARKLEELVLADYLEQAFTKPEMLELYLNVIEFGPDVYGITQAAQHYFGRKPAELNLAECLFLSSILPSPIKFHRLAEKPSLSEGWTKHLRDLMVIAAKLGTISAAELEEGLKEDVAFHDAKEPPPAPRPPVSGTHFQSMIDPSPEWEETP